MRIINILRDKISGEIYDDIIHRISYSTDASVYKEMPIGVVFPKNNDDIKFIISVAKTEKTSIIPRAAGTSLAGQVVGDGLVVDITKHFNKILEINEKEKYAIVQPGVVRDELNLVLAEKGYFFAPETATSNRCCIGGMCGNNSCGANSLIYGSTRQHILALKTILSDGSEVEFKALTLSEFNQKCEQKDFEGSIYRSIYQILKEKETQSEIKREFPDKAIVRRSMGYAIDELIDMQPFTDEKENTPLFNFCSLLVGSEGTLTFTTEIKLKITKLPPKPKLLLTIETENIEKALQANILALDYQPASIELIDNTILELSKQNITQNRNRFFLKGNPGALLIIEINELSDELVTSKSEEILNKLIKSNLISNWNIVRGKDMERVWALRKAGLGIMSNVKGDSKPVTVVEDIAILPQKYPEYFTDFRNLLNQYGLQCAYYAHISTGELHNKPLFNLKDKNDVQKFRNFATDAAKLVKRYGGSLSGEHGDGRLRGEFLPIMIGEKNYQIFRTIKQIFDPYNVFNRGKIVDTPQMNQHLRYDSQNIDLNKYKINTIFDFSDTDGLLRAIEKCNGSGDCKKSHLFHGSLCPTYMALKEECYSTRSRANLLREMITASNKGEEFNHKEIMKSISLCLACKACKSECPSNIDMTKIRAEFMYHYYEQHRLPLRNFIIANYTFFNNIGISFPRIYNLFCTNPFLSNLFKRIIGFAPQRSLPTVHSFSLHQWASKALKPKTTCIKTVYLFNDEFTNTTDVEIGISAIELLQKLGYEVRIVQHLSSGRTYLSKGMLGKAKRIAEGNISIFAPLINDNTPLIGIEPSAILSFRDEYIDLTRNEYKEIAKNLSKNCFLIDEFIVSEFEKGNIRREQFTDDSLNILFHAHCYQKSLSDSQKSISMMQIPSQYKVTEIKDCCCGMAGAFGFEKEHYQLSMQIGNLTLFPAIRAKSRETLVAATGTSCRHQIKDGTGIKSYHPIEILRKALK